MPENIIKKETLEGQYLVILSSQGLFYTIKSASRGLKKVHRKTVRSVPA